jgi:hypothetical protein
VSEKESEAERIAFEKYGNVSSLAVIIRPEAANDAELDEPDVAANGRRAGSEDGGRTQAERLYDCGGAQT